MGMAEKIKTLLIKRGNISEAELARRIGVSPQNLSNKMKRDNFTETDLKEIAAALNCSYQFAFVIDETGEII